MAMTDASSTIKTLGDCHQLQNGGQETTDLLAFSFESPPTLHPYLKSRRKRRRSESSLLITSISMHAILIGLLLYETSSRCCHRPGLVNALMNTRPTENHQQRQTLETFFRYRYDFLLRRRHTRLWDREVTSDPINNLATTTSTISYIKNRPLTFPNNNGVQQPHSTNGSTVFINGITNGSHHPTNQQTTNSLSVPPQVILPDELDHPRPTAKGGYTHTNASRAKISAANKGKVPWNKGKARSEEVRARIAEGVRAKNRERFLQRLEDMGITEEEYETQKKEERRKREAERRARMTENGGYALTEETKAKISKSLKEKHASGQIKKRQLDPNSVRRGFTHSEETRRKISESLKKRWKTDDNYRDHMTKSYSKANSKEEIRKKISETLKKRWADPNFRVDMTKRMSDSRSRRGTVRHDSNYRKKLSEVMKKKWQDPEYRKKTLTSIQVFTQSRPSTTPAPRRVKKTKPLPKTESINMKPITPLSPEDLALRKKKKMLSSKTSSTEKPVVVTPVEPRKASTTKSKIKGVETTTTTTCSDSIVLTNIDLELRPPQNESKEKKKKKKQKPKPSHEGADGSVLRLKEERRDLFDLLYGDEDMLQGDDDDEEEDLLRVDSAKESTFAKMGIILGDEDLDTFDPYGLDDY